MEHIVGGLEDGHYVGSVFCDLSKAFDCVDHDILIRKLDYYGVTDISLQLISTYLKNRRQQTCNGNTPSDIKTLNYGVPQGSLLGPLFFLVFINDITNTTQNELILFANDTTLL